MLIVGRVYKSKIVDRIEWVIKQDIPHAKQFSDAGQVRTKKWHPKVHGTNQKSNVIVGDVPYDNLNMLV